MSFLNLIFPKKCLGCDKLGAYFCPSCQKEIKVWPIQICPVCNRSAIHGLTHPKCQKRTAPDGLISIFVYQGLIKEGIKKLKYKPWRYHLAEELIELAIRQLTKPRHSDPEFTSGEESHPEGILCRFAPQDDALLIPIPLHWFRQNWRGFNQATVLGKKLAQKLKIKFLPDLLYRRRYTHPQTQLTRDERQENIQEAFKIHPKYFPNTLNSLKTQTQKLSVLLFDDVWTTGATLRECARVLKNSGFQKVFCLTLAR